MLGLGVSLFVAIVVYIIASLRRLSPSELGAVDFFGKPWYETGPGGLLIVPLGICGLNRFSTRGNQAEWPDEPENVQEEDPDNLRPGMTQPMRINFQSFEQAKWYKDDDSTWEHPMSWDEYLNTFPEAIRDEVRESIKQDPLHHTVVAKVKAVTQWRNLRGYLFQFMRVMGDPDDHDYVAEANRRINDTISGTIQSMSARITMRHALERMNLLNDKLKLSIEILIGEKEGKLHSDAAKPTAVSDDRHGEPWGIDLDTAYIKAIEAGKTINEEIAKASAAIKSRQTQILNAQAEAEAERLKGKARADNEEVYGAARAKSIEKVADAMKSPDAKFAAVLETTEEVASKAAFIIAPEAGGLVASVAAQARGVMDAWEKSKSQDKPSRPRPGFEQK